jgi:hypothetical protein
MSTLMDTVDTKTLSNPAEASETTLLGNGQWLVIAGGTHDAGCKSRLRFDSTIEANVPRPNRARVSPRRRPL